MNELCFVDNRQLRHRLESYNYNCRYSPAEQFLGSSFKDLHQQDHSKEVLSVLILYYPILYVIT